ncbi:TAXI family TRAP transporter solute-binding subunit [Nocardioides pantholopis]|uniref:TAXI family TRAP transporter solute-binding subunit n=1 Tax=Nocardioides pantholopis TaxID=2483798 RepID=UPI000F0838B7|nr:TAXI family TRAP transporter solute-binding subunit [Nocardioides pantholopis]
MKKRSALIGVGAALALAVTGCGSSSSAGGGSGQVIISTYGTGTATYADMAAVANAMTEVSGTKTRIITSDTSTGRMMPLVKGTAQFARTGDEYIFAFEGDHEFATEAWGPQPMRVVWAPTLPASFVVRSDSGITTPADLAGKKIPEFTSNPSVNSKVDSLLAAGGLTRDDVKVVNVEYSAQAEALKAGKADVMFSSVAASTLFELEGQTDIRWIELDAEDEEMVAAVQEKSPSVELAEFTDGAAQQDGQSDVGFYYPMPVVATSETSAEAVQDVVSGIVDSFDKYEDSTSTTPLWSIDEASLVPAQVPFHEGLVEFLTEKDVWTEEAQARQDELLAREKELAAGWDEVSEDASESELAEAWAEWKSENLAG